MKSLLLLILVFGVGGELAYEEGRFHEALEAFTEAERTAGHAASAELLYNKALAALRAGELLTAEAAAEKTAARGGPAFYALRDFLLGNAAFARCVKAELETKRPLAKPSSFDTAIALAETAGRFWQRAAVSRADWPEARRNVERALLKAAELKSKKEEAMQQQEQKTKKPEPQQAETGGELKHTRQESVIKPFLEELESEQVMRLLEKLNEKEKEKRFLRRARQRLQEKIVEKDW